MSNSITMFKKIYQPFITNLYFQQLRTTFVLKRRHTAPLAKIHNAPKIRKRHRIYEELENNMLKPRQLNILLKKYVEDVGRPGDVVSLKENDARLLILTKFAEYASEENIAKHGSAVLSDIDSFSSRHVGFTMRNLSDFVLAVTMSKDNPWTLEPWHIRCAFRKAHVHVPEYAFTMPAKPIRGPDMSLEGKEFYTIVTINQKETVPVRCRIHHWTKHDRDRLPPVRDHWKFPVEPIFPEDADTPKKLNMPEIIPPILLPTDGPKYLKNKKKR